ncbi:MAG: prepilin-type N-terminal cleavage/methylation domain-containing protein [Phycisphaerales bacterium]|nr:prepilin-type N-terminal cleavage/methylation domain-containing protein [Phycisphaerales bacterium]
MKKQIKPLRKTRRAFSIIELMGVLALIGILAGISALAIPKILNDARVGSTKQSMKVVAGAISLYQTQNKGNVPPTGQINVLLPLVQSPSDLEDAWGQQFLYYAPSVVNGVNVDWLLVSFGPNRIDDAGGADDIYWYPGAQD